MRKKCTKKFGKIGISAIVVMLAAGIAIPVFAGSSYSELFKNWGQKLKEYADKENTETEQLQSQNMIIPQVFMNYKVMMKLLQERKQKLIF